MKFRSVIPAALLGVSLLGCGRSAGDVFRLGGSGAWDTIPVVSNGEVVIRLQSAEVAALVKHCPACGWYADTVNTTTPGEYYESIWIVYGESYSYDGRKLTTRHTVGAPIATRNGFEARFKVRTLADLRAQPGRYRVTVRANGGYDSKDITLARHGCYFAANCGAPPEEATGCTTAHDTGLHVLWHGGLADGVVDTSQCTKDLWITAGSGNEDAFELTLDKIVYEIAQYED